MNTPATPEKRCSSCGEDWSAVGDDELPGVIKAHYSAAHGLGKPAPPEGLTPDEFAQAAFFAADYEPASLRRMLAEGRFTLEEIQTGAIALAGLERLYQKLEARGGPHDDRLVMAIQFLKSIFQDSAAPAPAKPLNPQAAARRLSDIANKLELVAHELGIRPPTGDRKARLTSAIAESGQALITIAGELAP